MNIKSSKAFKKVVAGIAVMGVAATMFSTGASAATVGTDSVSVTASTGDWGNQVYSSGGDFQVKIPAHSVSKKTNTTPRMYVTLYSMDGSKKTSITTWTVYGSMNSKTTTLHKDVSKYVDGSNKKAELKVHYSADFTTSFKASLID